MDPDPPTPRELLLDALVAHLAEHGLLDTSLRGLAAAVGSSHRMLSYHFGSRRGLLVAVSRHVEQAQRDGLVALMSSTEAPTDVMRQMYVQLTDPALWPHERLFFELYARALQGDAEARPFLDDVVSAWLPPVERLFARMGFAAQDARAEARLALAVSRGLLLDLLATEDSAAAHAAMEAYMRRFDAS